MDTLAALGLRIDGRKAIATLNQYTGSAHNAGRATEHFERTTKNLTASLGVLGGYFGVRQLVEYADTWTLISARIGLVTDSTEQMMTVQQRLFEISQRTRNTLAATSVLYTRVALNADQLGRSHEELLTMVESVNAAMLLSGATGVESAQAMRQLAQALGSGRIQGDEFRTMMEAMPLVARAIADEMGVALGDLYKLSAKGLIDVQTVIDALIDRNEELVERASGMQFTIGQAFEIFANAVTRIIGILNQATSISATFSKVMVTLAENVDRIVALIGAATAALVVYRVATIAARMVTMAFTAADILKSFLLTARYIREMAGAMAMLQFVGKGALGVIGGIAALTVGIVAYRRILAEIREETDKWVNANANLDESIGVAADRIDENALKTRNRIADMIREAHQAVVLAGLQEHAQDEMAVRFEAVNARIEAQRELTGELQSAMIGAINTVEQLQMEELEVARAVEAANKALEEHEKIVDQFGQNLQRSLGDVFFKIFQDGISTFTELFDSVKRIFLRMLAEMAAAKAMQKVGTALATVIGSALGTSEVAAQALAKGASAAKQASEHLPNAMGSGGLTPVKLEAVSAKAGQSLLSGIAAILGPAAIGFGVGTMFGRTTTNSTHGAIGGAMSGAAAGALAGSIIPGVGTVVGGAVGGLMGAIGGWISSSEKQRAELKKHREVLRSNSMRIQELKDAIEGSTFVERSLEARGLAQQLIEIFNTEGPAAFIRGGPLTEQQEALVKSMAEQYGITLGSVEAMEQFIEAIDLSLQAITEFGRNLQDITTRIEAYNKLFNVEMTPQQALQDTLTVLQQMAPQLVEQMGLTGLDLTTEAGRQALLEGLRNIYTMIASGELTPELLGAFTDKNQLLDAILRVKDALDEFHQELFKVTTDFPRAMDIIFYEQKFGKYGMGNVGATPFENIITDYVPNGNSVGFVVEGDIVISPAPGESGELILNRIEHAARVRASRGGAVNINKSKGSL